MMNPNEGGSYLRNADGSLTRLEAAPALIVTPATKSEAPLANEPEKDAPAPKDTMTSDNRKRLEP